jgi:cell division protein FtsW
MSRRIPYDRTFLLVVLALVGFGLIMVFSASGVLSQRFHGSPNVIFVRQLAYIVLGLLLMFTVMRVDYHLYSSRVFVFACLAFTAVLLGIVLLCPPLHGARRWIVFSGLRFQPSELAKLSVILFTAYYLVVCGERFRDFWKGLVPHLLVVGGIVGLIFVEPDLGTGAAILAAVGFLLFFAGLRYQYLIAAVLIAIPALGLYIYLADYRIDRILTFFYPDRDPLGAGYHIRQSLIAIGSGGLKGLGYALGVQKQFFLPEAHNDFIFAVIGEELGLWGVGLTLILFTTLFLKGVKIALRADTQFGIYLGLGLVFLITLQALINMSVVLSLLPTKGIPLPLISVGGSSMLVTLVAVGILLNISRHGRRDPAAAALLGEEAAPTHGD